MYLALGTLDQRLRFYARTDAGADGFIRPVYVFTAERWGRVDATNERAQVPLSPQAHVEHRTDAVATIAEGIAVDLNGLVKLGTDLYFVRGVVRIRQLRCQRLALEAVDPTAFATFTLVEGQSVLDGLHLVDPAPTGSFLLLEDGSYLLLEDGNRIALESTVAVVEYLLLEDGNYLLLENGSRILLETSAPISGFSSGFSNGFA